MTKPSDLEQQLQSARTKWQQIQQQLELSVFEDASLPMEEMAQLCNAFEALELTAQSLHSQNKGLTRTQSVLEWDGSLYQTLFNAAPDAHLVTDEQGIIQLANRSAEALFRGHCPALEGKPLIDLIAKSNHSLISRQLEQVNQLVVHQQSHSEGHLQSHTHCCCSGLANLFLQDQAVSLQTREQETNCIASLSVSGTNLGQGKWLINWVFRDSQQQQPAAYLREREQRYTTLVATAPVGIFRYDTAGYCTYANTYYCQISGLSIEAIMGQGWQDGLHPNDRDRIMAAWEQTLQKKHPFQLEYRFQHRDGTVKWAYTQVVPERAANGQVSGYVGTVTDITELKETEAELHRYERIFSATADGISLVNSDYVYQIVNQTYLNKSGKAYNEIVGHSIRELGETAFLSQIKPRLDQCLAGEVVQYTDWFNYAGVGQRFVSVNYAPYREIDNKISGVIVSTRDITELKQLESALHLSEQKLSDILRSAIASIASFRLFPDNTWEYDYCSEGCEAVFGFTAAELMADPRLWCSRIPLEDRQSVITPLWANLQAQKTASREYRFYNKAGSLRWILSRLVSRRDEANDCWIVTAVDFDITDRKAAELSLQAKTEELDRFFSVSLDLLCIADIDGHFHRLNPQWEKTLGCRLEQLEGASFFDYVHPDDLDITLEAMALLKAQKELLNFVNRYRCCNGDYCWLEWRAFSVGQFFYAAARDISDRKQAEEALRQSEERWSLAVEGTHDGIWDHNLITNDYFLSPRCLEIVGYDYKAVDTFQKWFSYIHPADQLVLQRTFQAYLNHETPIYAAEYRMGCHDGSEKWLLARGKALWDETGRAVRVVGSITDITQRKRTELALQQLSQELMEWRDRYDIAAWASGQVLFEYNLVTDADTWGPNTESVLGYATNAMPQGIEQYISFIHPEDRAAFRRVIEHDRTATESYQVEFRFRRADGAYLWVEERGMTRYNLQGEAIQVIGYLADISERKQAEARLRESEQRYASLAAAAPVGIYRMSARSNNCVYVNERWCQISGLSPEVAMGQGWKQVLHPDDHDRVITEWEQSLRERRPFQLEYRYRPTNGAITWVYEQAVTELDADGQVIGYVGTVTDISDRKRSEEALQNSEAHQRALISALPDLLMRINRDGIYQEFLANPTFRVIGNLAELVGNHVSASLPPKVAQQCLDSLQLALKSGSIQIYEQDLSIDGQMQIEEVRIVPYSENEVLALVRDISDRKQAENERLQAEQTRKELQMLEQILDTVLAGYWDWDIPNNQEYLSPGFKRMFGYEDGELPNTPDSWQSLIFPEDLPKVLACLEQHIHSQGKLPYYREVRYRHKNGSTVWVICSGKVIEWDDKGNPLRMIGCHIDISDRKHAELTLKKAEERYSLATRAAKVGVWEWNLRTNNFYLDSNIKALLGYSDAEIPNDIDYWSRFIHPRDREAVMTAAQDYLDGITSEYVLEHRMLHKNGSIVWILVRGQLLRDEHGNPERFLGTDTDITHRKRAEQALRESEVRWQFALEGAGDGVWDWNTQTNTVFYSRQWKTMLGYAEHELGNRLEDWDSRIHPDDQAQVQADLHQHFSGETTIYQNEHRIQCKDGNYKWILSRGKVIEWTVEGHPLRVIGTHTDATDRKLTEQKIREQAALLDIASDAIIVRDLNQHILYWNQGAERIYGWQASEAFMQKADEILRTNDSQMKTILQKLLDEDKWQGELRKITKAGKEVIVEGRWTLARDETGQPKFILCVDTDITEKKQLAAQFYQAQRLDSLGRLTSGIAHDLNNVLTPILTIAQLLRLTQPSLNIQGKEQLQLLMDSAERGAHLVKQILTFTRGSSEDRTPVDLASLLHEVANITRQSFPKCIKIRQHLPGSENTTRSLGAVSADPTHLHQVFMNLCINARDAMPYGGVLTISATNDFVNESIAHMNWDAQVGDFAVITIADTGIGIAPEVRDHMFDPFFTTKDIGQGTGLGLSTVLGIVKNYGGFLQVSSEVGQGTQVKVYLPTTEAAPAPNSPTGQWLNGNGELILVVDDDDAVQCSTQSLLEHSDYKTFVANDGVQAIECYRQFQDDISLIVLDVMMPNMDGITLIQTLKSLNPAAKIIAISGLSTNRDPVLAAGASVFLAKPYPLEDLLRSVWNLVRDNT